MPNRIPNDRFEHHSVLVIVCRAGFFDIGLDQITLADHHHITHLNAVEDLYSASISATDLHGPHLVHVADLNEYDIHLAQVCSASTGTARGTSVRDNSTSA